MELVAAAQGPGDHRHLRDPRSDRGAGDGRPDRGAARRADRPDGQPGGSVPPPGQPLHRRLPGRGELPGRRGHRGTRRAADRPLRRCGPARDRPGAGWAAGHDGAAPGGWHLARGSPRRPEQCAGGDGRPPRVPGRPLAPCGAEPAPTSPSSCSPRRRPTTRGSGCASRWSAAWSWRRTGHRSSGERARPARLYPRSSHAPTGSAGFTSASLRRATRPTSAAARQGQRDPEDAAVAHLALGPDRAAVRLDHPSGDRQPQAAAPRCP